jgi:hypothetical protein
MAKPKPVPTYLARIEESADGFRAVVTCDGETVHRGETLPSREAARKDAALFVILRQEDKRVLRWVEDDAEPPPATDSEPYRYPVWRGGEQVGWVTLEYPLQAGTANSGTFYPGPETGSVATVLAAAEAGRAWEAALYQPAGASARAAGRVKRQAKRPALQELFEYHEAALGQIESLGLAAGDPPIPISGLTVGVDWRINFYAAGDQSRPQV